MSSIEVHSSQLKNGVLLIAPFCPANRGGLAALGGAAKISAVIQGMRENDFDVLLINSGHQLEKVRGTSVRRSKHGRQNCIEVEPLTIRKRNIGKLLQCFLAPLIMVRIIYKWKPKYVWIYNPYLFEVICLCTGKLLKTNLVTILELEDLPNSRQRKGTGIIKSFLDSLALKVALMIVNGVTVVQRQMCDAKGSRRLIWYLPVLLGHIEINPATTQSPIRIGYFGGLEVEKGVDVLIDLIRATQASHQWIVCGSGSLKYKLEMTAREFSDRFTFLGCVDDQRFKAVYCQVNAIINLHKPIEAFSAGIFPYKLLEAVAHGKIVLSTPMLGCPDQVKDAIYWLEGDPLQAGLNAVAIVEEIEMKLRPARIEAQKWVLANYSSRNAIGRIFHDLQSAT